MLLLALKRWVEQKVSTSKYQKMSGVVLDALLVALQRLSISLPEMLKDGTLDADEKAALKNIAKQIIKERFKELRGVALHSAMIWAETQLDAELGKLEARILGITPQEDGLTEEDANVEASDPADISGTGGSNA
jgi:hypothetical protein